jgi:hypothetical protein
MCIKNPNRNPTQSIICHHLKLNIRMYYLIILIRIRSDTDPTPHHIRHQKKICICNRIRVISTSLHIWQKNMDVNMVKVLSDSTRSAFIPSCHSLQDWVT